METICKRLFCVLFVLAVLGVALPARAVVTATLSGSALTVDMPAGAPNNDNCLLSVEGGQVKINGVDPTGGPVAPAGINQITVTCAQTGVNTINLGAVTIANGFAGVTVNVTETGGGNNVVTGTDFNDAITVGGGADTVRGGLGDDTLKGNAGNDVFYGGPGNDSLTGDGGADVLYGEEGNDVINGNAGVDRIFPGPGSDTISASTDTNDDYIIIDLLAGSDVDTVNGDTGATGVDYLVVNCGPFYWGWEMVNVAGTSVNAPVAGYSAINYNAAIEVVDFCPNALVNGAGQLLITNNANMVVSVDSGNVKVNGLNPNGGAATAASSIASAVARNWSTINGVIFDLSVISAANGFTNPALAASTVPITSFYNNDIVYGTQFNDSIITVDGNDTIYLGAGDDYCNSGAQPDILYSTSGADTMLTGAGAETIHVTARPVGVNVSVDGEGNTTDQIDLLRFDGMGNPVNNSNPGPYPLSPTASATNAGVLSGANIGSVNWTGIENVIIFNEDFPGVLSVSPINDAYLGLAPVPAWGTVRVAFDKAVTGVDAADLTVGGVAATAVAQGPDASIWDFSGLTWPAAAGSVALSVGPAITAAVGGIPMKAAYNWAVNLDDIPLAIATQNFVKPTLDGVINPGEWEGTAIDLLEIVAGDEVNVSGPADLSAKMYVNYDAKWLYLAFDIADNTIANNPVTGSLWLNDSIEIFFDSDLSRTADNGAPGGQYRINWDGQASGNSDNLANFGSGSTAEWYGVAAVNATGWAAELRFSLDRIGEPVAPVTIADTIGFNVQINDNDSGTRDTRLWYYLIPALTESSGRSDRWAYLGFGPWTNPPAAAGNWQLFE